MNRLNNQLTEQTVIFLSVVKWIFLSVSIGAIIGYVVAFFLKILHYSFDARADMPFSYYYILPFALVGSLFLVRKFAPSAEGHGTEKVIAAIHNNHGKIDVKVIPIKLLATVLTLFAGGSAGKEGPGAQIGAGTASFIASIFKFDINDRKKLVICGISAGFATVFGTPIAGAIFGVEVLFIGAIMYDVLLPSVVSGLTAFMVSKSIGIEYTNYNVFFYPHSDVDQLLFGEVLLSGLFFGFISILLIYMVKFVSYINKKIDLNEYVKVFFAGIVLVLLSLFFGQRYLGLGLDVISDALSIQNFQIPWYDSFMKMIYTSITLCFGGSGGILTPIFYIGTTSGHLFADLVSGYAPLFAAIGFVSVLSGTTNAPIASSIMAVELFGIDVAQYAAISCVISYLITGHRSVFPSQILAMKKSSALSVKVGTDIEHTVVEYDTKKQKRLFRLLRQKMRKRNSLTNKTHSKKPNKQKGSR